jgi:hypothetical protein
VKVFKEKALISLAVLVLFAMLLAIFMPGPLGSTPPNWLEGRIVRTLQEIVTAQAAFRTKAPGGGYRRKDIAGLYTQSGPDGSPLHLIERSLAVSDGMLSTKIDQYGPSPKAGYWYRAHRFSGETTVVPDRFAVCASPAESSVGRWMYIVDDTAVAYRKVCPDAKPIDVYPGNPEAEGWEKVPTSAQR